MGHKTNNYMMNNENGVSIVTPENLYDVTPNPRYLESLRDTGYDNYQAINDIVDNSVDAILSTDDNPNPFIKILTKFSEKGKGKIIIVDNGTGMIKNRLIEALRLGSDTNKDRNEDLGFSVSHLKVLQFQLVVDSK